MAINAIKLEVSWFLCIIKEMEDRSYNQFCALASALDVVGERWTLLIVRELFTGPRRFRDLLVGLPCISTNLLTERLKTLERQGIVRRRALPPPAGSKVYELTAVGRSLEKALVELGRWGSQFLPPSLEGVALPSLGATALAIQAFFHPEQALGVDETYEIDLGEEVLQVRIKDGAIHVQQGLALNSDVIFYTDIRNFMMLFTGQITPEEAISRGLVRIEGDPASLNRFMNACRVQTSNVHRLLPALENGAS
jgi:DNA-binding HxlR family transcriptional regulator/putative sterol carrier protein